MTRIAFIGDYVPSNPTHAATNSAFRHSSDKLKADLETGWVGTDQVDDALFEQVDGVLFAPGGPYKDVDRALAAIRYAREHGVPALGTCAGFQHMIIEYARNVLGVATAKHAEYEPVPADAADAFITPLVCSLAGRSMSLTFDPESRVASAYGSTSATEQYYCNFGVDPSRVDAIKAGPMKVTGADAEGVIRVIEWPDSPFFVGTLFVPQVKSLPTKPHPLITSLVRAAVSRARARAK
jgi:CTP synthase (UTP-ammonia lyase)